MSDLELKKMIEAAYAGGKILRNYFGTTLEVTEKSTVADFRTKADLDAEKAILEVLSQAFPAYNIDSEEAGYLNKDSEYTFIIDPLDGTNNFSLSIPYFSVSIALTKNDIAIAAVVYQPITHQLYTAQKGKGAYLNGNRMQVSSEHNIQRATISHSDGYQTDTKHVRKLINNLDQLNVKRLLTNWSTALELCLVAAGKTEGIIVNGPQIHDYMAGKLLIREAGGFITNFQGIEQIEDISEQFIATNGHQIHEQLLAAWEYRETE